MPKKGEKATTEGRKDNQKMKPYLVYQYLLHNSDENHVIAADDIVAYIEEKGISFGSWKMNITTWKTWKKLRKKAEAMKILSSMIITDRRKASMSITESMTLQTSALSPNVSTLPNTSHSQRRSGLFLL